MSVPEMISVDRFCDGGDDDRACEKRDTCLWHIAHIDLQESNKEGGSFRYISATQCMMDQFSEYESLQSNLFERAYHHNQKGAK